MIENEKQINATFSVGHMRAVRDALGTIPVGKFAGIRAGTDLQDTQQATDLTINLHHRAIAVRVRRPAYYKGGHGDLSIRYRTRWAMPTEIHKLRSGFCDLFFIGFSSNGIDALRAWWLFDLHAMRSAQVLEAYNVGMQGWRVHANGDGTEALYIPVDALEAYQVARSAPPAPAPVVQHQLFG